MPTLKDRITTKLAANKRLLFFVGAQTLIIIILLAIVIFRGPSPTPKVEDIEVELRKSIAANTREFQILQRQIEVVTHRYDSLERTKSKFKIIHDTQIKYIEASPLDTTYQRIRRYLKGAK